MTLRFPFLRLCLICLVLPALVMGSRVPSAAGTPAPKAAEQTVAGIRIRIMADADKGIWDSLARDLLPLKTGEPFTLEALEECITALKDARLFESIHIPDPEKTTAGVFLTFELTPFPRIKDIRVRHAFPLFQREVLNVMNIETGDAFARKTVADQAGRVEQLFRQQGFADARARVSWEKDPKDGYYVVDVDVAKGPYRKIRKVTFTGNRSVSASRLRLATSTFRRTLLFGSARRFVPRDMKEDIKTVTALYRKKGFADVRVTADTVETGTDNLDVVFTIEEGPLYRIEFQGNQTLSERALTRDLTLARDGNPNNFALKKSLREIKKRYAAEGFPAAQIREAAPAKEAGPGTVSARAEEENLRQVQIRIDEGPRYRVAGLKISGNLALSTKRIAENILTPEKGGLFNAKILEEDVAAIRTLYLTQGFSGATVKKQVTFQDSDGGKTRWASVAITITEGARTRVAAVSFSGLDGVEREAALADLALKPGRLYNQTLLDPDTTALHRIISEAGYPHARVTADTAFSGDRSGVDIVYTVRQGPQVRVGRIFYAGNLRTREEVLADEMKIAAGDPFVLSKVVESRRQILNLNAIDSARIRSVGLKTREEEVDLIVEVSEKKPYSVELGTGYDTERHLYLSTGIGDRNLTGRNLNLGAGAELSQIGYKVDASLADPRFFSTRIISHTRVFTEQREEFNKDFGIRTYGMSQDFIRRFWNESLSVNLGFVYEFRDQYLTEERPLTDEEAAEYRTRHVGVITPGITYRTTDSYVRPRKGVLASANMDLSKGIDADLDDFVKFRTEARYYFPLGPLTLALRGRYGHILPYGNNTQVPDDQLFFLGGTSTVRGFDENMLRFDAAGNSVGGMEMVLGSAEARLDLGRNIEAALFYDTGAVRRPQGPGSSESFRDSVGLGLRYQTPVGPIGFLYGWKLSPEPNESTGSFHFSMGYTF